MALTHAQRTSMFNALAQAMGQDDAETLMEHLPPSGWANVATKEDLMAISADLRAGFAETNAAIAAGLAQAAVERAEIKAQAATERAEIIKTVTDGLAQAAVERAEIKAQAATERADIKAQAANERADIIRRQAWHLYVVVSTIVVASLSIWIALLTLPGAGG